MTSPLKPTQAAVSALRTVVLRLGRMPQAPLCEPRWKCGRTLVERFDEVKFGIFQRKSANLKGLVLFCIEADFCSQILIFLSILRDLQDLHTFAPLQAQNLCKNSSNFFSHFCSDFCKNPDFSTIFIEVCTDFDDFCSEFRRTF